MDSITQALLGATIGEAGFRRRLGGKAVAVGAIGGTLPDLDIVAGLFGEWANLVHHRGFSHSLFFAPLVAWPLGTLAWRWSKRRGRRRDWVWLVFWSVITHPLLDLCTAYGTQLFHPLTNHRFAIDAVSIIDPVYTGLLAFSLLVALASHRRPRVGSTAAWVALTLTTAYLGWGYARSQRAIHTARAALPAAVQPHELRALPTYGNLVLWRIVARDDRGAVAVGQLSLREDGPTTRVEVLARPEDARLDAALATPEGRIVTWFTMGYWSARFVTEEGVDVLYVDDQRYGSLVEPTRSLWGARFTFDPDGRVEQVQWDRARRTRIDLSGEWDALMRGIFGED